MTFKAVFLCAVIAGVSTLAISCAAPAQTSQTENTKPIETVTLPAAENFTTVGKPTKTIETPWGPREIYDPAKDEEFLYKTRDYFNNSGSPSQTLSDVKQIYESEFQQSLLYDYGRIGCKRLTTAFCSRRSTDYFKEPCPENQNFGEPKLSQCETDNLKIVLPPAQVLVGKCMLHGTIHESLASRGKSSKSVSRDEFFKMECTEWNVNFAN